jgi:hypothetical protein
MKQATECNIIIKKQADPNHVRQTHEIQFQLALSKDFKTLATEVYAQFCLRHFAGRSKSMPAAGPKGL